MHCLKRSCPYLLKLENYFYFCNVRYGFRIKAKHDLGEVSKQDQKSTRCDISKPDIAKPKTAKPDTAKPDTADRLKDIA